MPPPPSTDRLTFREMELGDLGFMSGLLGDPRVMTYYPGPYSRDEALAWIEWNRRLYRERGFGLWLIALRETGVPIGDCGITPQDVNGVEEIEVGYHVHPAYQERGYAREAVASVRRYARTDLGIHRLVAIVHPDNVASRRVAESIGLVLTQEVQRSVGRCLVFAGEA
jgi:RimJ/RimL family protein N-acetyltransferase